MDWLNAAVTLGSGLLGAQSSKEGTSTTSEKKLDPRMDRYIYGADGQSGLMGSAFGLAQEQMQNGGLNDMQRQGMDMQRQYLMSPQYQQGFGNMANMGQSLMGAGVAANPFTGGQNVKGPANLPSFAYSGAQNAQLPDYKMQPGLVGSANTVPAGQRESYNAGLLRETGGGGDKGPGQTMGTGNMTDAINAQMQETFKSYLALGMTPAAAMALVEAARATNGVMGAVNEAADPIGALNGIQGWTKTDQSYDPYSGRTTGRGFNTTSGGGFGGSDGTNGGTGTSFR